MKELGIVTLLVGVPVVLDLVLLIMERRIERKEHEEYQGCCHVCCGCHECAVEKCSCCECVGECTCGDCECSCHLQTSHEEECGCCGKPLTECQCSCSCHKH